MLPPRCIGQVRGCGAEPAYRNDLGPGVKIACTTGESISCPTLLTTIAAILLCAVPAVDAAPPVTATFTDSQGRTTLYRYSLKDDWDPTQPRGLLVFFHGNNYGTPDEMLSHFFPWMEGLAWERGLVPVVPASPDAADMNYIHLSRDRGTRGWDRQKDTLLIHEFLQNGLSAHLNVDYDRVVFFGASDGTCFLNDFFAQYGEHYGGGLFAWCGCLYEVPAENMMVPSQEFKNKFSVLVQATTEDFLYTEGLKTFAHYKYTLGLETRGDLARSGGHCWEGEIEKGKAIDWLLGDEELAEDAPVPHFKRVTTLDHIRGMTVDSSAVLWVARQLPQSGVEATLWRSVDQGQSWETVSRIGLRVTDLDAVHDQLFLGTDSGLYRSADRGVGFRRVLPYPVDRVVTDTRDRLYVSSPNAQGTFDIRLSQDLGRTWSEWSTATGPLQRDPILVTESAQVIAGDAIRSTESGRWTEFFDSEFGPVHSAAWDGYALWGLTGEWWGGGRLLKSVDKGATWNDSGLPAELANERISSYTRVSALGQDRLLMYQFSFGGTSQYATALMSEDLGQEWFPVLGGPRANGGASGQQWIAAHPQVDAVFVTSGTGIFALDVPDRADRRLAPADSDSDGVVDASDAFPFDGLEYLDTDGDGIGNSLDGDDDGDGVHDSLDGAPLDRFEWRDTDGDGIGNDPDPDDDGDRTEDVFDAFPLDPSEWVDADGDGIGDLSDTDDDGDGVDDIDDPFPRLSSEWADTDGDGIGNNVDRDDDNDGLLDDFDEEPLSGVRVNQLAVTRYSRKISFPAYWVRSKQHQDKPDAFAYPEPKGTCPVYGSISLGDGAIQEFQWMVDMPSCGYGSLNTRIHVDRNGNGILTDDGAPIIVNGNRAEQIRMVLQYASGEVFPYYISLGVPYPPLEGMSLSASAASFWSGEVAAPGGPVGVWIVDLNSDAVFQDFVESDGASDFLCIDLNRDQRADCWPEDPGTTAAERISPHEQFTLDGKLYRAVIPPSGHKVDLVRVGGTQ